MSKATICAISHYVPPCIQTSEEIEGLIIKNSGNIIPAGLITKITGVSNRHVTDKDMYNSTLAIKASEKLFKDFAIDPQNIDLLIFASAGQDILEPATAHIISKEIGTTSATVMDVKNACNSFLNALEIATCFIEKGKYNSILIVTGEVPTKAARFTINDRKDLKQCFPAYVFGDAGSAVLVRSKFGFATIKDSYFFSDSNNWESATFPGGGSRHFHDAGAYSFEASANALVTPFLLHTKNLLHKFLAKHKITTKEISRFFVHQITNYYLHKVCIDLDIPIEKIEMTIKDYGNMAAASIPVGMSIGFAKSPPLPGTLGLLIGFAGGISIGFVLLEF